MTFDRLQKKRFFIKTIRTQPKVRAIHYILLLLTLSVVQILPSSLQLTKKDVFHYPLRGT